MGWSAQRGIGALARVAALLVPLALEALLAAPTLAADPRETVLAEVERDVREADGLLRQARFEEALGRAGEARRRLAGAGDGSEARRLRVRTEVLAATVHVALEQEEAARNCFRRALAVEPALELDEASISPKVLRVFRAVRAEPRVRR
jgi:hypothetical protein